ncbi:GNAT family N-acetyltransferase [Streptomyces sp. NPDC059176]|uniref:GNAT family N-acetyltransferase n=1 Tax=unclassified Streptomyces TaxID=2593676 RepID=UPI00367DD140
MLVPAAADGLRGTVSSPTSMDVRPLTPGDRAAWDPLWRAYLEFYDHALPPQVTDATWERLVDPAEPMGGLGAWTDGALVGICHYVLHRSTWAKGSYCYLEDLFTAPAARGRGAATALVEATAAAARDAGAEKLYWQTHADNTTARALYDRLARHEGFLVYERPLT